MKPRLLFRLRTVACIYCGRLCLGENWLRHHQDQISQPLWYRALWGRLQKTRNQATITNLQLAAFHAWVRK